MKYIKLLIASLCSLSSCDQNIFTNCPGDYSFYSNNLFGFTVLDKKTKENVLLVGQLNYNYDTVKVYNEDWSVVRNHEVGFDGRVSLPFIDLQKDNGTVNQLISRRFFMYFNHEDIDTIDIDFEMKYNKCDDQVMKYFKVAYNDSVYYEGSRVTGVNFLKEKVPFF